VLHAGMGGLPMSDFFDRPAAFDESPHPGHMCT
jgi:hypothetical protein